MIPSNATTYSIPEAALVARRSINTIRRWIVSGQLKTLPKSPMQDKRRTVIGAHDLYLACTRKLVPFKQPRYPHLFRKREIDKERRRAKYARTPKTKAYNRQWSRYRRAKLKASNNAVT